MSALDIDGSWIACHDTLVCAGAQQIQKWCVREGDAKGPLVAVMLTKEVAHALAAAPNLLELTRLFERAVEYEIRVSQKAGDDEGARLKRVTLHLIREAIAKATGA